ncbi:MAG TPA: hypothetical protein DDY86_01455 [Syntrophaceae bacterium]|nr:hypothetical protein [Syntrophaceae bacterium]HCS76626.1 hypothetical protein [Syntrophaceae bacterium]
MALLFAFDFPSARVARLLVVRPMMDSINHGAGIFNRSFYGAPDLPSAEFLRYLQEIRILS